jgi:HlyD family secretion protein
MDRVINNQKPFYMKWIVVMPFSILIIGVITFIIYSKKGFQVKVDKKKLTISQVKNGNFQEFIPVSAEVLPIRTIRMDAEEGGRVEELYVQDGEKVKRGQNLLRLSNSSLQMNYLNQESQIASQINQLRNTRISLEEQNLRLHEELLTAEYDKIKSYRKYVSDSQLYVIKAVAKLDFEKSKDEYEYQLQKIELIKKKVNSNTVLKQLQIQQIDPTLLMLNKSMEYIHEGLENFIIKSPIDGKLTSLKIELGQNIGRGENIGQIDVMEGYKMKAKIDEHYLSRIEEGLIGEADIIGVSHQVMIKKIFSQVENGQFEVDFHFINYIPSSIKRGQTISIRLSLSNVNVALLLERGSFYQTTGGHWVYLINKEKGIAIKHQVQIGRQNPENFEVLKGLKEGDEVIISSYETFNLADELILNN